METTFNFDPILYIRFLSNQRGFMSLTIEHPESNQMQFVEHIDCHGAHDEAPGDPRRSRRNDPRSMSPHKAFSLDRVRSHPSHAPRRFPSIGLLPTLHKGATLRRASSRVSLCRDRRDAERPVQDGVSLLAPARPHQEPRSLCRTITRSLPASRSRPASRLPAICGVLW